MDPDEEKYGVIAPIERSPYFGAASDAAGGVRRFFNKAQIPEVIPLIGGAGVGDMLVGEAPEELNRWAHGFSPFKDRNVPGYAGLRGIPDIQPSRAGPLADTLFLGADAAGLGMGTAALGRAGMRGAGRQFQRAINDEGMDASRRKFVKDAGTVAGAAAVASATPDLVKAGLRGLKKLAPEPTTVATRVAKNAFKTFPEYTARVRALDSLRDAVVSKRLKKILGDDTDYQAAAWRRDQRYEDAANNWELEQSYLAPEDRYPGDFEDFLEAKGGGYTDEDVLMGDRYDEAYREANDRWQNYRNAEVDALREANPEWAKKLDDFNDFERQWSEARTNIYADSDSIGGSLSAEARSAKLAQLDKTYKKAAKEKFGVLYDDADVLEQFKYGTENYVDPITGVEPTITYTPDGQEVLEWTRKELMENAPQTWARRHWVPEAPIPDKDTLIDEILKAEQFTGKLPPNTTLRQLPF